MYCAMFKYMSEAYCRCVALMRICPSIQRGRRLLCSHEIVLALVGHISCGQGSDSTLVAASWRVDSYAHYAVFEGPAVDSAINALKMLSSSETTVGGSEAW